MAAAGAFGAAVTGAAAELAYWKLSGGYEPGAVTRLFKDDAAAIEAAAGQAAASLRRLIAAFDDETRAYLSQPHPGRRPRFPEYAHLARVAEWESVEDGS
jgi:ATP-dependent helicase/nuclease subunit B